MFTGVDHNLGDLPFHLAHRDVVPVRSQLSGRASRAGRNAAHLSVPGRPGGGDADGGGGFCAPRDPRREPRPRMGAAGPPAPVRVARDPRPPGRAAGPACSSSPAVGSASSGSAATWTPPATASSACCAGRPTTTRSCPGPAALGEHRDHDADPAALVPARDAAVPDRGHPVVAGDHRGRSRPRAGAGCWPPARSWASCRSPTRMPSPRRWPSRFALAVLFPDPRGWARSLGAARSRPPFPRSSSSPTGRRCSRGRFLGWQVGWDRERARRPASSGGSTSACSSPRCSSRSSGAGAGPWSSGRLLRFYLPFALCFVVPNLVRLSPWIWDNIKFMIWWHIVSAVLVALLLARLWRSGRAGRAAAGILFVLLDPLRVARPLARGRRQDRSCRSSLPKAPRSRRTSSPTRRRARSSSTPPPTTRRCT